MLPLVVLVTMQLKFQQSIVEFLKVLQLQFFDRLVATSVASQRGLTVQTVQKTGDSMVQFWMVVDMPVGVQTTGFGQTVQETVAPQLHSSDKVVDAPAVAVHRRLDVPVIM